MATKQMESVLSEAKEYVLEVSDPVSVRSSTKYQNAPRLGDLNGKTIGIWMSKRIHWSDKVIKMGDRNAGHYREGETFPVIEELLKKRFPDIKIIPGTEMPGYEDYVFAPKSSIEAKLQEVTKAVKEKKCDAVILGNGA